VVRQSSPAGMGMPAYGWVKGQCNSHAAGQEPRLLCGRTVRSRILHGSFTPTAQTFPIILV
jgi:hypothetical protein